MLLVLANAELFHCTEADEQVAEEHVNGRTLKSCTKPVLHGCKLIATYTDGSQNTYNSPNSRLSSDFGVVYTG